MFSKYIAVVGLLSLSCSLGFISKVHVRSNTKLFSDNQNVKDLNLEEMQTLFQAADNTIISKVTDLPGIVAPTGFFDPVGFSSSASPEQVKLYREAELKHGRVAMLAFAGIVVGELTNPLFGSQITGPAIYQFQQADAILPFFWIGVLALIGSIEARTIATAYQSVDETLSTTTRVAQLRKDYEPGSLGFDPLGLAPTDEQKLKNIKTKELSNGRLAMLAVLGIVLQELKTGESIF